MKLAYSPYSLRKKQKLNALDSGAEQSGALIKVIEGDFWGVADLCPKPELDDAALDLEIKNKGILFLRAVELAIEDMLARKNQKSLLQNKFVKNNFLCGPVADLNLENPLYFNNTVKIKVDSDIMSLSQKLNNVHEDVKVRLDFNSSLNERQFELFLSFLNEKAKAAIEYIEDPTVICDQWRDWNRIIPLAFDFQKAEYQSNLAKYRIIKPSRQRVGENINFITLTSAMDHPVGVAHGLRVAQGVAVNDSGFLTLDLFEDIGFNRYFEQKNNYLNFSTQALNDFGIGMTEQLNKLDWTLLT